MAPSFPRRNAFARAFHGLHDVLAGFADTCEIRNSATGEPKSITSSNDNGGPDILAVNPLRHKHAIMELSMAQFVVRLIETRARGSGNVALGSFAMATRTAYDELIVAKLGPGFIIASGDGPVHAVAVFQQSLSQIIFGALIAEAEDQRFDEADFWFDVAMALTLSRQRLHPIWATVIYDVFLSRMDAFREALAEEIG